ncbi:DUF5995 family protein [Rhodococcus opacus]|uniref:DUF5995 family protein n=1 Tax=Rhodococcus opacus TaxID=37919 RepID=UPI0010EE9A87|nr:DUF5995 family protein [Rhodococcus opacus]MDV7088622.1 DUF5995 family protein [Rhodococcus opacus]RYE42323.1 MAG: hypothetical protein EOP24_33170 [Hyphomicrobiales bacterium]
MQAGNLDDVLSILDTLIADTKARRDPLGYFAALYRQVTLEVRKQIDNGFFDDGQRMDRFDTLFANRYFTAYDTFITGEQPSRVWNKAFKSVQSGQLIILQNLRVGINAHINLDLGVVTGETFQGATLDDFHDDFDKINDILSSLIPQVQNTIEQFSPLLGTLEVLGGGQGAAEVLDFSLDAARDDAWFHATLISLQPPTVRQLTVRALDGKATFLGRLITQPVEPVATAVTLIRATEDTNVPAIITALDNIVEP